MRRVQRAGDGLFAVGRVDEHTGGNGHAGAPAQNGEAVAGLERDRAAGVERADAALGGGAVQRRVMRLQGFVQCGLRGGMRRGLGVAQHRR